MKRLLLWLLIPPMFGLMLAAAYLPLPVPPYLDFQVLYHANTGLLEGISLYDHAGQINMIANLAGVAPDQVWVLPFPYPPWYALSTLPLAMLPVQVAARLWMELNLAMLIFAIWLITDGWKAWMRLAAFPIALFFLPAFGALMVGQYVFPAVLGAGLLIWSLREKRPILLALSAALLTFKPHIGGLVILAALTHLWFRRQDAFARRALWMTLLTGAVLFFLGFLADAAWPVSYLNSLLGFKGASACRQCVSLPMAVVSIFGWGLDQAIYVAGILLIGIGLLFGSRLKGWKEAEWISPVSICVALIVNPYLQSYDFAFLLVPLAFLAGKARGWRDWMWFWVAFILPWLRVGLPADRGGDAALLFSALLVSAVVLVMMRRRPLDSPIPKLYNQQNSLREE